MNEELKEILDKLKNENNYEVDCNNGSSYKELFANEINLLLDYITNLQEENNELTKIRDMYIQYVYNEDLKKEEQLEKYINKVINTDTTHEKVTCSYILDKLEELKESDNNVKEINTNNN